MDTMVTRKQRAETSRRRGKDARVCYMSKEGAWPGALCQPSVWLHTGVVTWSARKVTIAEFKIAASGRTDAADSGMCMGLCKPDERHEKVLLLNTVSVVNLRTEMMWQQEFTEIETKRAEGGTMN